MRKRFKKPLLLVFLGILAGGVWELFLCRFFYPGKIRMDEDVLYAIKHGTVNRDAYFWYVLAKRVKPLIITGLLATTWMGIYAVWLGLVHMGFSFGMLVAMSMEQYRLKGMILPLVIIFPQYILYVPVFLYWFRACYEISLLFRGANKGREGETDFGKEKPYGMAILMLPFLGGVLLESFLNPGIVKAFLKIF